MKESTEQPDEESHSGFTPKGWHSRGFIPHLDSERVVQHVTFRLIDSLPAAALSRIERELNELPPSAHEVERRRKLEAMIDAGYGACWLRRGECAQVVMDSLLHFDKIRYRLFAWVIMPNHVHVLFQAFPGWSVDTVVGSWKTFTAGRIGRLVMAPDQPLPKVWFPEFWDRFIRDERHFHNAVTYIHNNPVKAGLASRPEEWPWSSASQGAANPD